MQTKKFVAKAFGVQDVVDAIEDCPTPGLYTIFDGDFLRNTWFRLNHLEKPHYSAVMINGVWALVVHKEYIMRKLSSLEEQLM